MTLRQLMLNEAPGDEIPDPEIPSEPEAPADPASADSGDDVWNVGDGEDSNESPAKDSKEKVEPENDEGVNEPEGEPGNPEDEPPSAMVRIEKAIKDLKRTAAEFIKQYGAGVLDDKGAEEVQRRMAELVYREEGKDKNKIKSAMKKDSGLSSVVNSIASLNQD